LKNSNKCFILKLGRIMAVWKGGKRDEKALGDHHGV
jgi:hypothetical protein